MQRFLVILVLLVPFIFCTKTATLDRSKLTQNQVRAAFLQATHRLHAMNLEGCINGIREDDRNIIPEANRCICRWKDELTFIDRMPGRRLGLNEACRDPTPPPNINIHDTTINFHQLCGTIGTRERWVFCVLFGSDKDL